MEDEQGRGGRCTPSPPLELGARACVVRITVGILLGLVEHSLRDVAPLFDDALEISDNVGIRSRRRDCSRLIFDLCKSQC
eukprot:7341469-Prymnesium_polylepis.2